MDVVTALFIYLLIWWVMLFAVLPLGVERHADEGVGHDAGAPRQPHLKKKIILTSLLSAGLLLLIHLLIVADVIRWSEWFRGPG
ncbi:MAG TPA: DUF1467 family protein [Patescibacteria group bacterium]|nr:DUF1467 family protein [Patescibacteria group bacterium]